MIIYLINIIKKLERELYLQFYLFISFILKSHVFKNIFFTFHPSGQPSFLRLIFSKLTAKCPTGIWQMKLQEVARGPPFSLFHLLLSPPPHLSRHTSTPPSSSLDVLNGPDWPKIRSEHFRNRSKIIEKSDWNVSSKFYKLIIELI